MSKKLSFSYGASGGTTSQRLVEEWVFFPSLWNLLVNELLVKLEGKDFRTFGVANDVAIEETFLTYRDRMNMAREL